MKILILGGTSFVGRAIVTEAIAAGHEVTLFSRGRTGAELFPGIDRRVGDRSTGDYAALTPGAWDAVVDVTGYIPRHVQQAAAAVGEVCRYLFISTGSVYDPRLAPATVTEDAARFAPERGTEEITETSYGPLKVACEDDVLTTFAERATIVRPGVVAGPHDPSDRFTWWVRRAARGGPVALPGRPEQPVQVVDSRDLARLVVSLLHDDRPGIFNAVGPAEATTLAGLLRACAQAAGTQIEVVPVPLDSVAPGFPLILPDPSADIMFQRSAAAARAVGLTGTPLEQTAAATLAWDRDRGQPPLQVELAPQREEELLRKNAPGRRRLD